MEIDIIAHRVRGLIIRQNEIEMRIHDLEMSLSRLAERVADLEVGKGRAPTAATRPTTWDVPK